MSLSTNLGCKNGFFSFFFIMVTYPVTRIGRGADWPLQASSIGICLLSQDLTLRRNGVAISVTPTVVDSRRHGQAMWQLHRRRTRIRTRGHGGHLWMLNFLLDVELWRVNGGLVGAVATAAIAAGDDTAGAGGGRGTARVDDAAQAGPGDNCLSISHHLHFPRTVSFVHGAEFVATSSHSVVSYGCNHKIIENWGHTIQET